MMACSRRRDAGAVFLLFIFKTKTWKKRGKTSLDFSIFFTAHLRFFATPNENGRHGRDVLLGVFKKLFAFLLGEDGHCARILGRVEAEEVFLLLGLEDLPRLVVVTGVTGAVSNFEVLKTGIELPLVLVMTEKIVLQEELRRHPGMVKTQDVVMKKLTNVTLLHPRVVLFGAQAGHQGEALFFKTLMNKNIEKNAIDLNVGELHDEHLHGVRYREVGKEGREAALLDLHRHRYRTPNLVKTRGTGRVVYLGAPKGGEPVLQEERDLPRIGTRIPRSARGGGFPGLRPMAIATVESSVAQGPVCLAWPPLEGRLAAMKKGPKPKSKMHSERELGPLEVLRLLESRFKTVQLKNWPVRAKTAEIWVAPDRSLEGAFKKAALAELKNTRSDAAWHSAAFDVLQGLLTGLPAHSMELLGDYSYDEKNPRLPDRVALFFFFGSRMKTERKTDAHWRSTRRPGDEEAVRSRRRRAKAARDGEDAEGRGYVEPDDDYDPELSSWRPTTAGELVMRAAAAEWQSPGCASHAKLAKRLNEMHLTSLEGRPFSKKNVWRVIRGVELLRGGEEGRGTWGPRTSDQATRQD